MSKHKIAAEAAKKIYDLWEQIYDGDDAGYETLDESYQKYLEVSAEAMAENFNADLFVQLGQTLLAGEHLVDQWEGIQMLHERLV